MGDVVVKKLRADSRKWHEKKKKCFHIIEGIAAVIFIICIFAGTILPYFSYTKDGPTKTYSIKISSRSTVDYKHAYVTPRVALIMAILFGIGLLSFIILNIVVSIEINFF
jgi:hypothetical protein